MSSLVSANAAVPITVAAGDPTTLIKSGGSRLVGVVFAPTAIVSPVVTFWDNATATASGTKLATIQIEGVVKTQAFWFGGDEGISALLGIAVSGTFTTLPFTVYFKS